MTNVKPTVRRRIHGIMFRLPGMISCREFEDFVLAYLDDELSTSQRRIFEIHLKLCRECREYLEVYKKALHATRNIGQDVRATLAEVPDDLVTAILEANR